MQLLTGLHLNILTAFGQSCLDSCAANDFAHDSFGRYLDCYVRLGKVEQILASIGNAPKYHKIDIDNIFITGDHLTFIGNIAS